MNAELVIIGGGPAGLAAALAARKAGITDIWILEREKELGGILNQCIHNGFGLHIFKEELTGPEYAHRYIQGVRQHNIPHMLSTTVVHISPEKLVTAVSRERGLLQIQAKAVVLAMGCRERPRGALGIPGYNPAGVYSAGTAQKLVNLQGFMPGKEVVILGSGDIGLIMARRMTLEGATVKLVAEIQPFSGGLKRNIVQCLEDFGIPLLLSHTVVEIHGRDRVEGVTVAAVDAAYKPIAGTERFYRCDTLLLSVGLIPENELSKEIGVSLSPVTKGPKVNERLETCREGVFACGNVLHVHDLVDDVSEEAEAAGQNAAAYLTGNRQAREDEIPLQAGGAVRYTVPERISPAQMPEKTVVRFRVGENIRNGTVYVYGGAALLAKKRRPVMSPGEMEQITLNRDVLIGKAFGQITVTTAERGEA